MRFVKIDVVKKKVYEIDLEDSLDGIYQGLECDDFEHVMMLPNGDVLLVDEYGLLKSNPVGAFVFRMFHRPLAGHGLIMGVGSRGQTIPAKSTVSQISSLTEFVPVQLLKGIPTQMQVVSLTKEDLQFWMKYGRLPDHKMPPNPQ